MNQFFNKNILVTGCTGSGKTFFLNKIIKTLVEENSSTDLGLILIDPKRVEFAMYEGMSHMLSKVIYSTEEAKIVFEWTWKESLRRIRKMETINQEKDNTTNKLQTIVIVIDEFSDLICTSKNFFEEYVEKITAFSNKTGIYLIISTSRPSPEDVYTEKIRNCFLNRVCFCVGSEKDSVLMIGEKGAETLSKPRNCLIKDLSTLEIESFQVPHITYEEIEKTIEENKK